MAKQSSQVEEEIDDELDPNEPVVTDDEVVETEVEETPDDEDVDVEGRVAAAPVETPNLYRDALRESGLTDVPDDPRQLAAYIQNTRQAALSAQQWQPYLNEYTQNAGQFRQWQAEQQQRAMQQQQQAPQKPKLPWEALPEYDKEWLNLVMRDENGNLVAKPGAMPDLPQKIMAYTQAREQALTKLLQDPYGTMQEGLTPFIQEQARQIVQQQFQQSQQYQQQQYTGQRAQELIGQNSAWLFEQNSQGQTIQDFTGRRQLTEAGKLYNAKVGELAQYGIVDPDMAHNLAMEHLESTLYRLEQKSGSVQTNDEKKKLAFLKKPTHAPNRGTEAVAAKKPKPGQRFDIAKVLSERLEALSDDDLP